MYWIPSSLFQASQTLAMKNENVRLFLGLQPLRQAAPPPPPPPTDAYDQVPIKKIVGLCRGTKKVEVGGIVYKTLLEELELLCRKD